MAKGAMVNYIYTYAIILFPLAVCSYRALTVPLFVSEFKLGPEELERWFTKIDHIFEHTRIPPVGEVLSPFYKTTVKRLKKYDLPLVSHVNHK